MSARLRKLVGMVAMLGFLAVYVTVAAKVSDYVPRGGWQLAYFVVVGVLWGVPLFPLISWMSRGR